MAIVALKLLPRACKQAAHEELSLSVALIDRVLTAFNGAGRVAYSLTQEKATRVNQVAFWIDICLGSVVHDADENFKGLISFRRVLSVFHHSP